MMAPGGSIRPQTEPGPTILRAWTLKTSILGLKQRFIYFLLFRFDPFKDECVGTRRHWPHSILAVPDYGYHGVPR